jgi:aminopeptidase-like protein
MRSKYGEYPEYHTSDDDLSLISPEGLNGTLEILKSCIQGLESNHIYESAFSCEPQLGKRGLYPTLSTRETAAQVRSMMNVIGYADGRADLLAIAERIGEPIELCAELAQKLLAAGVLRKLECS